MCRILGSILYRLPCSVAVYISIRVLQDQRKHQATCCGQMRCHKTAWQSSLVAY